MTLCIGNLKFGEMEFGEMKRNTSNWSNFCMLPRREGLSASAGLSCHCLFVLNVLAVNLTGRSMDFLNTFLTSASNCT